MLRIWRMPLGLRDRTVLEHVEVDEDTEIVVAHVRPKRPKVHRCGRCGRVSPHEDAGEGRRRWRSLDLGTVRVYLEADAPRVRCVEHGVTVIAFPWARHKARQTRAFEDTVAWLVTRCSKTAVAGLLRGVWRTVGAIVTRVVADIDGQIDRFAGLRRIGIDEISYKRGHKYLTVVVDHDSGRLVWAAAMLRRCQHPLIEGGGNGAFEGATGRLDFKDARGRRRGRAPDINAVDDRAR